VDTYTPRLVIPDLAESWSNPRFGRVKTYDGDTSGTPVLFIGAGYSETNSAGKAVLVIDVRDGSVVKIFSNADTTINGMDFSIASDVTILDTDNNGFIDKAYVGDMGGQMWRLGSFTDSGGTPLVFPDSDENITHWTAQTIFSAGCDEADCTNGLDDDGNGLFDEWRKFFYPPSVTLEVGYDLVLSGTGDRNNPCDESSNDLVFAVRDTHDSSSLTIADLFDVTYPDVYAYSVPNLDAGDASDAGWYYRLAAGEKMLAEGVVFFKVFYFTTFTPNDDACLPGGVARLYALNYKTGEAVIDFDGSGTFQRSVDIGGGIPSKPVLVISDGDGTTKILISVGSSTPDEVSDSEAAGVLAVDPNIPTKNFFYLWWQKLVN
jgi:type IV pilus assembly protein PilY1